MGLHTGEPKVGRGAVCRYRRPSCGPYRRRGSRRPGAALLDDQGSWRRRICRRRDDPRSGRASAEGHRAAAAPLPARDRRPRQRFRAAEARSTSSSRRKRRRMYAGSALIGVLAAAVAIPVFAFGTGWLERRGDRAGERRRRDRSRLEPGGRRRCRSARGRARSRPAPGSLWVANLDDQTVVARRPGDAQRHAHALGCRHADRACDLRRAPRGWSGSNPAGAVGERQAYRSAVRHRRAQDSGSATSWPGGRARRRRPGAPSGLRPPPVCSLDSIRAPAGPRPAIDPNAGPTSVAVGAGATWITDSDANTVTRVDATGLLTPIAVGHGPSRDRRRGGRCLGG